MDGFPTQFGLIGTVVVFTLAATVILLAGIRLSAIAERIAASTGFGQALVGAALLGGTTSLAGIVTSVSSAVLMLPEMAASNAIGGIAAQTAFLAIADLTYRRVNLEHAAASAANLVQGPLLITLLAIPLVTAALPPWTFWHISPASVALISLYLFGLHMTTEVRDRPMWQPQQTAETQCDEPRGDEPRGDDATRGGGGEGPRRRHRSAPWLSFAALALTVACAGLALTESARDLVAHTNLSQSAVGGLFTAVVTSLPELVTAVAAVHRGALVLAVGGIIGGNAFDVLFLALADFAYLPGSLYHAMGETNRFTLATAILMTGILLLGLIRREKYGPARIGLESTAILGLYALFAAVVAQS